METVLLQTNKGNRVLECFSGRLSEEVYKGTSIVKLRLMYGHKVHSGLVRGPPPGVVMVV